VAEAEPATRRGRGLQRSEHQILLLAGDTAAAIVALMMALWVWSLTTGFSFGFSFVRDHREWLLAVPVWVTVIASTRSWHVAHAVELTVRSLMSSAGVILAAYIVLYFYAPPVTLARLPALYFLWDAILLTLGWRLIYLFVIGRGSLSRRAIIVGTGPKADAAVALLQQNARDIEVIGTFADPPSIDAAAIESLRQSGVSEVLLAIDAAPSAALSTWLLRLQERGIDVVPFAVEYEQRLQRVPIQYLDADWAFTSLPEWVRLRDASLLGKRLVDVLGAIAGGVILAALSGPVALAIWLDDGFPIIFRQRRLGKGGHPFDILKFRTMALDAEAGGAQWAAADDPRVTAVGRWLRRARLDEWPQIINVFRGDMSLVGPRPERPEFAERLGESIRFYHSRLTVRPGLTGWAQVNTDYGDSLDGQARKLEYDLYYIKHRSLLFDLWIVLRTMGTVLGLGGR
jgi:exopolysaccharide biosynthesis polyprenyl glycosylphosphotransferase